MVLEDRNVDNEDTDTFHQGDMRKKPELLTMLKKHKFRTESTQNLSFRTVVAKATSRKALLNFIALLDFLVVYTACFLTPISIMIQQRYDGNSFLTICLVLCDARFFYHCCKKLITQTYKTKLELTMLLLSFPTVFAWPICSIYSSQSSPNYWMWLSFTRMMKLMVLNTRYNELSTIMEQASVTFNDMLSRITKTVLYFFLYANLLACFWFYISCRDRRVCRSALQIDSYQGLHNDIHDTWILEDAHIDTTDVASCYFRSLHFIMVSLLTVGYGDIYPVNTYEICFSLYLMMNGVLFYGFLISSITSILASKDYTTKSFRNMISGLKEYFRLRSIGKSGAGSIDKLRDYFVSYYEYLYTKQYGMTESEIFRDLPGSLARDMKMTHFTALKRIGFFHVQNDLFVEMCLDKMTYVTYGPDSLVENNKDELKLVVMGKVNLMTKNGQHNVYTYFSGDCIGEFNFVFHDRTGKSLGGYTPKHKTVGEDMGVSIEDKYDIISSGFTTILVLDYSSFCEVVHEFSLLTLEHATSDASISSQEVMDEFSEKAAMYIHRLNEEQSETLESVDEDGVESFASNSKPNSASNTGGKITPKLPVSNGTNPRLVPGGPGMSPSNGNEITSPTVGRGKKSLSKAKPDPTPFQGMLVKRTSVSNFHRSVLHTVLTTGTPKGPHNDLVISDYQDPYVLKLTEGFAKTNRNYRAFAEKVSKVQSAAVQKARRRGLTAFMSISTASISTNNTIAPNSKWVLVWNLTLFTAILYYAIAIPLRIMLTIDCGAGEGTKVCLSRWYHSLIVDYLCDALFIVDFALRARFFAFRKFTGDVETVVTEPHAIFRKFRDSLSFYMDIAVAIPIDLIAIGTGYLLCWRLAKLATLLLLPRILSQIQSFLDREMSFNINAEAITVINLAIATFLLAVWIGVGYAIIRYNGNSEGFMTSYYWTFTTMTTTGYGDIVPVTLPQTIYTVFACFLAPTLFATIIGKFASYVKVVDISTDNVEHRLTTIQQFLKTSIFNGEFEAEIGAAKEEERHTQRGGRKSLADLKVPRNVVRKHYLSKLYSYVSKLWMPRMNLFTSGRYRVVPSFSMANLNVGPTESAKKRISNVASILELLINEYYEYIAGDSVAGLNERKIIKHGMPHYLMHKMRLMVVEDLIKNAGMFDAFDENFRKEIMLAMEQVFFCKKHIVLKKSVAADGMYFIKSGTLKFRHHNEAVYRIKSPGESIAEYSLVADGGSVPLYEIIAVTDCELWYLSRSDFQQALHKYPTNHQHMPNIRQHVEVVTEHHRTSVLNVMRIKAKAAEKNKRTISPTNPWMYLWTELIVLVTLYNLFIIPLRIAYYQDVGVDYPLYLDYIGDLIYLLDIILKGTFVAYRDQDELVRSNKKIFFHYIQTVEGRFHLAALIPTDLIAYAGRIGTMGTLQTIAVYRLNKLLRLYDLHANMMAIETVFLHLVKRFFNIKVDVNLIRIAKLIMVIIVSAYVFGSIFFIIANQNHLAHNYNNWADAHELFTSEHGEVFKTITNQCIQSTYWAMQVLTTTGYGDTVPVNDKEKLYNIFLFVLGVFLFATIIVYLQDIVSQLDVTSDLFKRRVTRIQEFLHREEMSHDYLEKVMKYYTVLWSHQRGADSQEIVEFIPQRLYLASIFNVAKNSVNDLFFVNKCTAVFQNAFISKLVVRHYIANDSLFRDGERSNKLFLVHSGEMSLIGFDDATADSNTRSSFDEGNARRRRSNNSKSGKKKQTRTLYLNVREGFVGESEFFSRSCYACSGKVNIDSILYEIDFETFWNLIVDQRLVNNFTKTVGREGMRLHRNSTLILVKKMNANIKNAKLAKMMSPADIIKHNDGTLLPDAIVLQIWNTVCLLILAFEAIMVPYFIAFDGQNHAMQLVLDTVFVVIGAIDIIGNLCYFAVEVEGNMITEAPVFRPLYIKGRLIWDVIGTLPLSLLYFAATKNYKVYRFLRLMYLVRLHNLLGLCMKFYRAFKLNFRVKIKMAKLRVFFTIMIYLYVIHMLACGFTFLGKYEIFFGRKNWIRGNLFNRMTDKFVYLRAFYWAMYSSTTIGYGSIVLHNNAERIYAAMTMILGSIMTAALSAMLSAIIESADSATSSLRRSHEAANKFCHTHHVEPEIRERISDYFKYMNDSLISSRESDDLKLLSASLKSEYVLNKIWKEAKKISFLDAKLFDKSMQYGFISSIVHYFDVYLAVPHEILLQIPLQQLQHIKKRGKTYKFLSRDLFFLRRGAVYSTVRDPDNCPTLTDTRKNYFSANQVIEVSSLVSDAPPEKVKATSARFDLDHKYDYSVKLVKMSINENEDGGGMIKIATTNVSLSKHAVADFTSSSVEFSKKKSMFNASFAHKDDKPTPVTKDDTVLFFDVCVGHTYAKEFTYHIGGAVFQIPELLKKIDQKVAKGDNDDESSSSGEDYIKTPHHSEHIAIKEEPPTIVEEIPESIPIRLFNSFTPFAASRRMSKVGASNKRGSQRSVSISEAVEQVAKSGQTSPSSPMNKGPPSPKNKSPSSPKHGFGSFLAMASGSKSPKSVPVTPKASVPVATNSTVRHHSIAYAEEPETVDLSMSISLPSAANRKGSNYANMPLQRAIKEHENEGDDDSTEEEEEPVTPKTPKVPGTFTETVTALILDDASDAIIGTVTIQVIAVKVEDATASVSEKKPEVMKVQMKKRFSNLLGVGSVGTDNSPRTGDNRKQSIETLKAMEIGLQRRMSEVMRRVDSVKIIPGLQRRMSNMTMGQSTEEAAQPFVVTQGEHKHGPNEIDLDSHTAVALAVSEGYSHLFRVPVSKLQEVESFFLMSLQTANHRINALPKKFGQQNR